MRAKKLIASAVAATTLGVGGLAVAAVNPLTGVGAQVNKTAPDATATAPDAKSGARTGAQAQRKPGAMLDEVLKGLVDKGTITQAQADAVKAALKEKAGEIGRRGPRKEHRRHVLKNVVKASADVIGISAKDLVAGLKEGKSIAEIAQANGVEPKAVTDKLVADATARIDKLVADGKIKPERAAKMKERLPTAMDKVVNHKRAPR